MALNHHYHLETYYAASCSGAVLHAINMRLSLEHIVHTIRHAGDKVLFFDDVFRGMVEGIYDQIKDTVEDLRLHLRRAGSARVEDRGAGPLRGPDPRSAVETFDWPYLDEDTKATACYTTGTTGLPKGVMFSHRALYLMILHQLALATFVNDPDAVRLGERTVPLLAVPLFHVHGWGVPYSAVFGANKLVLPGTFTVEGFCELVEKEKVTSTSFVPTVLAMLVEYPDLDEVRPVEPEDGGGRRRRALARLEDQGRAGDPRLPRLVGLRHDRDRAHHRGRVPQEDAGRRVRGGEGQAPGQDRHPGARPRGRGGGRRRASRCRRTTRPSARS